MPDPQTNVADDKAHLLRSSVVVATPAILSVLGVIAAFCWAHKDELIALGTAVLQALGFLASPAQALPAEAVATSNPQES